MNNILALDPATTTGWAAWQDGPGLSSGSFTIKPPKAGDLGGLGAHLAGWISAVECRWTLAGQPPVIAYETPVARFPAAVLAAGRREGVLAWWCHMHGVTPVGVSPNEAKKTATGKGNATKDQVRAGMIRRWGVSATITHDEADALAVLAWAQENIE